MMALPGRAPFRIALPWLILTLSVSTASAQGIATIPGMCPASLPIPPRPLIGESLLPDDIYLAADRAEYTRGGVSVMQGEADFSYGSQQVAAEKITFDEPANKIAIEGEVNYWDDRVYLHSPSGHIDLDADTGEFSDVRYWLLDNRGRGNAATVTVDAGSTTTGRRVDYTTCDPDTGGPFSLTTNVWKISASRLTLNHETERGSGRNVILKVKDIPIFYTPYISFPISDRRKSGLLVPVFGTSSRYGADLQIPYYWNIAPEMDATITPRLISNSGVMLSGEYRYLLERGNGELNLEYLPDDKVYDGRDRNSIGFRHDQRFGQQGRLRLLYNRVSDPDYLEDFSSSLTGTSTVFLEQSAILSWGFTPGGHSVNFYNVVSNYQIVDRNIPVSARPYKRLPSSTIYYSSPYRNGRPLLKATGRFDYFHRGEEVAVDNVNGARIDVYPTLSLPMYELSWFLQPSVGLRYTGYELEENTLFQDRRPDRLLPVASVDSGLFFERQTRLFGRDLLQTLEPRLYYLYVPETDQSDLPVFDTGRYNDSLASLFFDNRYSGPDRFGDANQLTMAVTSRLYRRDNGLHLGNISLGQTIHFSDRNVVLPGQPAQTGDLSAIIARVETAIIRYVDIKGELQWDPDLDRTRKASLNVQYRPEDGKVVNIGYRKHVSDPRVRVNNLFDVEQTDISFRWPINREWSAVGKWNFAVEEARSLDLFAGVEYNGCCWGGRLVARRFLSSLEGEFDTGIFMQFELKGLAGLGQKTVDFLSTSIPGYETEF